jgi:kinesin family protein 18/19
MLRVSYVEVYNENIKDLLLVERAAPDEYLDLREDNVKGVCVAGVTEIMTTNVEEIAKYIRQGNRLRTKERTDANETSSRSHAVLQITVEHKDKAHGINAEINIAKLSLIDLAGSERASNTNNRGLRLIEGANINKSLLALGNCINALCELTKQGGPTQKNMHIPYRDSKLTRLLKDSLGGNCRTVMITNISPAFAAYEDTLNTLKYADRAK